MRPQRDDIQGPKEREWLAGVGSEALNPDLGVEDSRGFAGRAKNLVVVRATKGDVAHDLTWHRQIGQNFRLGAKHRDSTLPSFLAMKIGHPQIASRIKRAAVSPGAAEVEKDFGLSEKIVVRGDGVAEDFFRLGLNHVEKLAGRID